MAQTLDLVVFDTAPPLRATLSNDDGVQDLTGATVVMRLKPNNGTTVLEIPMDIDADPTTGVVTHDWAAIETGTVLSYKAEFIVTYANNTIEAFPNEKSDVPSIKFRQRETAPV